MDIEEFDWSTCPNDKSSEEITPKKTTKKRKKKWRIKRIQSTVAGQAIADEYYKNQ